MNGSTNPTFSYDANGNMVSGAARTVTWNSFNMPAGISNQTRTGLKTAAFWYNPEHERTKEQQSDGSTVITLSPRYDTGLHFEKKYIAANGVATGAIEYEHYLYAGGQMFGKYITTTATDGVTQASTATEYYSRDNLGSMVAITDATGTVTQRMSYDIWGKRRYPNGFADAGGLLNNPDMVHGFTGHEMLDDFELIHMNGRLYDPVMARFVSADPTIQSPGSLQSYNRYSYVWNNPLIGTDPSGYLSLFGHKILPGVFNNNNARVAVAIAVAVYAPQFIGNFGAGFASGLVSSGGDLKAGLIGGLTAGAFGGLHGWEPSGFLDSAMKVAAHGAVGGVASVLQGGDFKSGFMASAFTQGASLSGAFDGIQGRVGNAVAAAIVGGTASVLGGGKFQNGAMTGAFSRMFNDLAIDFYNDKHTYVGHIGGHVVGEPSMGLYPQSDIDALSGNKTPGQVLFDQSEGGHGAPDKTVIINSTLAQDQKIREYLFANRGNSKLMYDLNADTARNCATFIETGLHYAGIYAPSYVQPRLLINDLEKNNKAK